ncbi:MAG TPA: AAA family ATPase [Herpetosiphonaceae bacterium]|nr:AAA family ATPase [Herpetosiphonaceae bacterium]
MSKPLVVIISGHPCTGKTTLGRMLARDLPLPLIAKDDIKETLFDKLGVGDRAWSQKLGRATYQLLYLGLLTQLRACRSAIVESNFSPAIAGAELHSLAAEHPFEPFQIICRTEREVLFERYRHRSVSGERHPGHLDQLLYRELVERYAEEHYGPLTIGGAVARVDTTDWTCVDYQALLSEIRAKLQGRF